mmetsp:Transcript_64504/g.192167  ORF Transcript_64504/g.192167 Transcript_64504/m.192167 type:complete len:201 (+) Transcript_64504:475-1077(+)
MRTRPARLLAMLLDSSSLRRSPKGRRVPLPTEDGPPCALAGRSRLPLRFRLEEPARAAPPTSPASASPPSEWLPQESPLAARPRLPGATQQRPRRVTSETALDGRGAPPFADADQSKSSARTRYPIRRRTRVRGAATQKALGSRGSAGSEEHLARVNIRARSPHSSSGGGRWFQTTSTTHGGSNSGDSLPLKKPEYKRPR